MSASADEKLQQGSGLFSTPPNYKPIEDEEFDFDVPEEFMNISLDAPFTCSSESDSFDLDALLGVSKRPLPSTTSAVTPSLLAREAQTDTFFLSTCVSAESKLSSPVGNTEPKLAVEMCEAGENLEEILFDSSCVHFGKDRQSKRSRHDTFTLSSKSKGKEGELSSTPPTEEPTPICPATQVRCTAVQDQSSTADDSTHPLVTPTDPPSWSVNSETYSKTSSLGLPVSTSTATKEKAPGSVTRLKMPSSLKKPSKARGTFNSSPLHCLHLDEIKSDLSKGQLLVSEIDSVSYASSASTDAIDPPPNGQPSCEEKARSTSGRNQSQKQVTVKQVQTKRPLVTRAGSGAAIVRRPSQLKKPLSAQLPQKMASKPDFMKQSAQQRQPLLKPVSAKQEAAIRPKSARGNRVSPGQAKKPVVGREEKAVLRSKSRKLTSTVTEATANDQCKDLPDGKSLATQQQKTSNGAERLNQATLEDKPPTQASSLPQQGKRKEKENESGTKVLAKKRRSFIPTPTANLDGKPANSAGPSDRKIKKKPLAFPAKFKEGSAPLLVKKATGIRLGPLRPLMPNTGPIKAKPLSKAAQDSLVDETVAEFQFMSITSNRRPVVHSPVNKENAPESPHSEWSPIRRKKPLLAVEECYQCTKYIHH